MPEFEISPQAVAEKLKLNETITVLDVRELWEVERVHLDDPHVTVLPLSRIGAELENAFPDSLKDRAAEIIVMCHHGSRSGQVTQWMRQNGWQNVRNLTGGIDAYAAKIDKTIGFY